MEGNQHVSKKHQIAVPFRDAPTKKRRKKPDRHFEKIPLYDPNNFKTQDSLKMRRAYCEWFLENINSVAALQDYGRYKKKMFGCPPQTRAPKIQDITGSMKSYRDRISALPTSVFEPFLCEPYAFLADSKWNNPMQGLDDITDILKTAPWYVKTLHGVIKAKGGDIGGFVGSNKIGGKYLFDLPEGTKRVYIGKKHNFWKKELDLWNSLSPLCHTDSDIKYVLQRTSQSDDTSDTDDDSYLRENDDVIVTM